MNEEKKLARNRKEIMKSLIEQNRIKRVIVKNLFNRLDYDIDFCNKENISVLIAPNGCGKTTIFNLISFCLGAADAETCRRTMSIPFDSFELIFEKGSIKIENDGCLESGRNNRNEDIRLIEEFRKSPYYQNSLDLDDVEEDEDRDNAYLERNIEKPVYIRKIEATHDNDKEKPFKEVIYCTNYASRNRNNRRYLFEYKDEDDVFGNKIITIKDKYGKKIDVYSDPYYTTKELRCFAIKILGVSLLSVGANRLEKLMTGESMLDIRRESDEKEDVLKSITKDIKIIVNRNTREYDRKIDVAKNKLVNNYVSGQGKRNITKDYLNFKKRWDEFRTTSIKYQEYGLIKDTSSLDLGNNMQEVYEDKWEFLEIYLDIFEPVLASLNDTYQKMKLFGDVFNSRNSSTGKKIDMSSYTTIDRECGITVDGNALSIDMLSSGEKHDFVMFYYLIFKSKRNSIFLIDEPEISLHIQWQEEFLDRLLEICQMNGCQAIVATHSPSIVNGHKELYVKKQVSVNEEQAGK